MAIYYDIAHITKQRRPRCAFDGAFFKPVLYVPLEPNGSQQIVKETGLCVCVRMCLETAFLENQ